MDLNKIEKKWMFEHFPEITDTINKTTYIPSILICIASVEKLQDRFISLKPVSEKLAYYWAFHVGNEDIMVKYMKSNQWIHVWADDIDISILYNIITKQKKQITKLKKELAATKHDPMDHFSAGTKKKYRRHTA